MQTKAKSNSVITHAVDESGAVITFNVLGAGSVAFDTTKASETCRLRAETHGFIQRISDAAAMSRNPETGKPATPAEKLEAMRELVAHYESGTTDWKRTATGGGGFGKSITVQAIANVKGIPFEQAQVYCQKYADSKYAGDLKKCLAFLRTGGTVATEIERLRKAAAKPAAVDADAALAELEG